MARFYKVSIDEFWLTLDGTESGRPCKVTVENLQKLLQPDTGNVSVGSAGSVFREKPLTPTGGGRDFAFVVAFMLSADYAALKAILDDAAADPGSDFNVTGTGLAGDFDVNATVFDNPTYISHERQSGDNLINVRISLITTAIN